MSTLASGFCPQQTCPSPSPPPAPPPSASAASVAALRRPRCRFGSGSGYPSLSSSLFFPRQRFGSNGRSCGSSRARLVMFVAASASSFDELHASGGRPGRGQYKNSILLNLIQEIEPLDVSFIQKDVSEDTTDAMKRTISSMLGLLPSDQFHVLVEAFWEPLSELLTSSIMTGYTLRNAEYRLCLERNLNICEKASEDKETAQADYGNPQQSSASTSTGFMPSRKNDLFQEKSNTEQTGNIEFQGLEMSPEVKEYIQSLQSELFSVKKELCDVKRKNCALEMQHFVGEEKNDLLDYLRSLHPDKVVELSETCPEMQEAIHLVVHGLLATLSPKMLSKAPLPSENAASGTLKDGKDDLPELVENTSIHFQPLVSLSRDYLARLIFWCMLLGHHLRGLEYRLELMQLLELPINVGSLDCDQVS